jgi:D-alanyl-D-alanine dipeptidase
VDVRLVTLDGQQLDMWSSLLDSHQRTWRTFSPHVTPAARDARRVLYDAMVGAGFSNCYDEWWHYSYGDSGWAARLGSPYALYGAVPEEQCPEELVAAVDRLRAEGKLTRLRLNRK